MTGERTVLWALYYVAGVPLHSEVWNGMQPERLVSNDIVFILKYLKQDQKTPCFQEKNKKTPLSTSYSWWSWKQLLKCSDQSDTGTASECLALLTSSLGSYLWQPLGTHARAVWACRDHAAILGQLRIGNDDEMLPSSLLQAGSAGGRSYRRDSSIQFPRGVASSIVPSCTGVPSVSISLFLPRTPAPWDHMAIRIIFTLASH